MERHNRAHRHETKIVYLRRHREEDQSAAHQVLSLIREVAVSEDNGGGDPMAMDWLARYIDKLDRDTSELKTEFRSLEARIDARIGQVIGAIDRALGEIRHLDDQRHRDLQVLNQRLDQEISGIHQRMEEWRRWLVALVITTIVGIAAMVLTVLLTVG